MVSIAVVSISRRRSGRRAPTHPNPNPKQECPNGEGISGLKVFRGFQPYYRTTLLHYDMTTFYPPLTTN